MCIIKLAQSENNFYIRHCTIHIYIFIYILWPSQSTDNDSTVFIFKTIPLFNRALARTSKNVDNRSESKFPKQQNTHKPSCYKTLTIILYSLRNIQIYLSPLHTVFPCHVLKKRLFYSSRTYTCTCATEYHRGYRLLLHMCVRAI